MRKNFVVASSLMLVLLFVLSFHANALTPKPVLDEANLKKSVLTRVGLLLKSNGQDNLASPLTEQNIKIGIIEPIKVQDIELFAVKVLLHNPENPNSSPDEMILLTEATGTVHFGIVANIATGQEMAMVQAKNITRLNLEDGLGHKLFIGTGKHKVKFISDPLCPYCRTAYNYLLDKKSFIASVELIHLPLAIHYGAEAASWIMDYAYDLNKKDLHSKVVDFAYKNLQAIEQSNKNPQLAVIEQFTKQFPELLQAKTLDELHIYLKNTYNSKLQETIAKLQKRQLTGTPVIVIDDQPVKGFNMQALDKHFAE